MALLNAALPNIIQWPNDAVLTLIQRRRAYQPDFNTTSLHRQKYIWRRIKQEIITAHPNFAPRRKQCRNKWNALRSGYENLKRLINGNPDEFPVHTPTLHDERFYNELSDEFWLTERKYLLFN